MSPPVLLGYDVLHILLLFICKNGVIPSVENIFPISTYSCTVCICWSYLCCNLQSLNVHKRTVTWHDTRGDACLVYSLFIRVVFAWKISFCFLSSLTWINTCLSLWCVGQEVLTNQSFTLSFQGFLSGWPNERWGECRYITSGGQQKLELHLCYNYIWSISAGS